jgi:thiamine-phosphate pyrophosphorylase
LRRSEQRILCLVTDRRGVAAPLETVVAEAVAGGVDWVQLRERDLDGRALCELAERVLSAARRAADANGRDVRVLINRRVDIALAVGADGVHLGWNAVPVAAARALLGTDAILGVAAHTTGEVRAAAAQGADYATLAPIYVPLSKPSDAAPLGPAAIGACSADLRVLAQGGIDVAQVAAVRRAGAAGIAVTGAVLGARDPRAAAAALRSALDGVVA